MDKSTKVKIKTILTWYRMSKMHFSDEKKLKLLNVWKDICVEFEEYEIASSLRKERSDLLREIRFNNQGKRKFYYKIIIKFKVVKRKVKNKFSF